MNRIRFEGFPRRQRFAVAQRFLSPLPGISLESFGWWCAASLRSRVRDWASGPYAAPRRFHGGREPAPAGRRTRL